MHTLFLTEIGGAVALGTAVAGFVIALGGGLFRYAKKAKQNGILAEREREREIRDRIDAAVCEEKEKWGSEKQRDDGRVERLRQLAEEWEKIANQRNARIAMLELEVQHLREQLVLVKKEHDAAVSLSLELRGQVEDLRERIRKLERAAA